MNVWNFTGNLGRDAEVRFTNDGKPVAGFSVAVKSGFGKGESTTWANCNLWGKQAESLAPYLSKGTQVGISGEVSLREWQDKDGMKRQSLDVRVNSVTLLGKKEGKQEKQEQQGKQDSDDSDIPF